MIGLLILSTIALKNASELEAKIRATTDLAQREVLLNQLASKKNATSSQIALAWLMAQKTFIVSIAGTRNIPHLNENLGAIDVQLSAEDLQELETEFSILKVYGGRMNAMQMTFCQ